MSESAADVHGKKVFSDTKKRQARVVAVPTFLAGMLEQHLEAVPLEPHALVSTGNTELFMICATPPRRC